jgi:hypothetical protein
MASVVSLFAQAPQWVTRRPVADGKFIGIGMALLSDPDCRNVAVNNAMLDIASQISVNIESSSFMQTLDVDGKSRELFEEKVKSKMAANISGQELKDSYQSGTHYYVYYELDRKKYEKHVADQKKKGTELGLDYYTKGRMAEASHSYVNAVKLYAKGLEAIEPYLYLDLKAKYEGRQIDLPTELYNACIGVFSGLELVQNVTEVGVEAFKPCGEPLAVCLSKGGEVIPNVTMKASFTSGDGALTADTKTDLTGTAAFYVTNVVSKLPVQTVEVRIDDSFIADIPESYRTLIDKSAWPAATFTLVLMNSNYTAYYMVEQNGVAACDKQIRAILVNNNFDLTEDTAANLFITLSTSFEVGGTVAGELYDMNECFAALTLKIYDNHSQKELLNYNVPQVRVLVPVDKSEQQTMAILSRELMKRVNAQLPQALKKLNINL